MDKYNPRKVTHTVCFYSICLLAHLFHSNNQVPVSYPSKTMLKNAQKWSYRVSPKTTSVTEDWGAWTDPHLGLSPGCGRFWGWVSPHRRSCFGEPSVRSQKRCSHRPGPRRSRWTELSRVGPETTHHLSPPVRQTQSESPRRQPGREGREWGTMERVRNQRGRWREKKKGRRETMMFYLLLSFSGEMAICYLKSDVLVGDWAKAMVPLVAVGTATRPDQDLSPAREHLHIEGTWEGDTRVCFKMSGGAGNWLIEGNDWFRGSD